jgi:hypothetical protein
MIANRLIWLNNLRLRLDVLKNSFVTRTTMTKPLSPAAHAVLDAYTDAPISGRVALAAALRAAANQVKHEFPLGPEYTEWDSGHDAGIRRALNKFLAIAAELEGGND